MYLVTRKFTAGLLAGLSHTERTSVKFQVGFVCAKPSASSPYVITAVEVVN